MPRCVAACCNNNHHSHGVSFHQFPKDESLRKKWVKAVSRTRQHFNGSAHSVLCGEHFAQHDFEPRSVLASSIGLSGRNCMRLKKGVIPTIFQKPIRPGQLIDNEKKKRRSMAYENRERSRVMAEMDLGTGQNYDAPSLSCTNEPDSSTVEVEAMHDAQVQTDPLEPSHCDCCVMLVSNQK